MEFLVACNALNSTQDGTNELYHIRFFFVCFFCAGNFNSTKTHLRKRMFGNNQCTLQIFLRGSLNFHVI
uniref:Uncharacterized protein n=1 Tax=Anguilla anguilla TaxID=7936 RepID=A0A0E9WXM3_ANGAN